MRKLIILILAALLPVVATAADTGSGSPPLTKKEQRRTLRGYKGLRGTRYGSDFPQLWHSCRTERQSTFYYGLWNRANDLPWISI